MKRPLLLVLQRTSNSMLGPSTCCCTATFGHLFPQRRIPSTHQRFSTQRSGRTSQQHAMDKLGIGFFERSFVRMNESAESGVLGLGSGHVGTSLDRLDQPARSTQTEEEETTSVTSSRVKRQERDIWKPVPVMTWKKRLVLFQALSKFRLASLVALTTMAGYAMVPPDPVTVNNVFESLLDSLPAGTHLSTLGINSTPPLSTTSLSFTLSTLLSTTTGTLLCIASANALNQLMEAPYDAQMSRTRGRPLVRRIITPLYAATFAGVTAVSGVTLLATMVNPLTAGIGFANIILYAFIYTPLKRMSIVNTWIGAVVGAIPPLMGWTAISGTLSNQPGAWAMFAIVFAWQFPHFNSLAHNLRRDYAKAGYRMMAVTQPLLNARVSFRYALFMFPLCSWIIPTLGLTTSTFAWLSVVPNLLMAWPAFQFWKFGGDARARTLFWSSLVHLPVVLILMMACKRKAEKVDDSITLNI